MTIDIEELRNFAKTAHCGHLPLEVSGSEMLELLDRLEAAESEAIEQARLNGMGSEREAALMAKLEAAEKTNREWLRANAPGGWIDNLRIENEALRAEVIHIKEVEFPRKAQAVADGWRGKLEAAEKERDDVAQQLVQSEIGKREISEAHNAVTGRLSVLADENTALRAKVKAMEQQEPVATVIKEGDSRYWMSERLWTFPDGKYPLYTLPGAQPAPSVPEVTDAMIEAIESRAEQSYRRHHSGIRGQQITPADALSWHIIRATRSVLVEAMEAKP